MLEALQRLPIDYQVTIELHYWQELSVNEIADALDVAAGTIKSRLSRARERLARELEQPQDEAIHTLVRYHRAARAA